MVSPPSGRTGLWTLLPLRAASIPWLLFRRRLPTATLVCGPTSTARRHALRHRLWLHATTTIQRSAMRTVAFSIAPSRQFGHVTFRQTAGGA